MNHEEGVSVVKLLLDTGVLDEKDVKTVQTAQTEVLLALMINKRALQAVEKKEARKILNELLLGRNLTKKLKAQAALVHIITKNLHKRMDRVSSVFKRQERRITSDEYPAVGGLIKCEE